MHAPATPRVRTLAKARDDMTSKHLASDIIIIIAFRRYAPTPHHVTSASCIPKGQKRFIDNVKKAFRL